MDKYNSDVIDFYVENKYYEEALLMLRPFIMNIRNSIINFTDNQYCKLFKFISEISPGLISYIESYYRFLSKEEIASDITVCLLTLINRYENQDKCFLGYMNTAFYFEFTRMLMKQNKDVLNHNGTKAFYDNGDANLEDITKDINNFIGQFDGVEDEFGYLTPKWAYEKPFEYNILNFLEPIEKDIIVKYYQDKMADSEIAATINKHINTINQRRLKSIKILEEELNIKYIRTRRPIKNKE